MPSSPNRQHGFTLIEIVCTLMVIGVLGALLFSGFSTALRGYSLMREAGTSTVQAELALVRLHKECRALASVQTLTGDTFAFTRMDGTRVTISGTGGSSKTGGVLTLTTETASGVLLANVSGFNVTRHPEDENAPLEYVTLTFSVQNSAGTVPYTLTVSPRNGQARTD